MKYSKADEIIFTYIVKGLVKLNKNPNYIKKFLEENKLCNKTTLKHFDQLTWQFLKMQWHNVYGWFETFSNLSLHTEIMLSSEETNTINPDSTSQGKKENHTIKIPYIEKLQLDDMVLNQDVNIEVSPNDAATLLKNISSFQSKLNEIITSVNTIVELINGETGRTPLITAANDDYKKNKIAYGENGGQMILINMAALQSKINEVAKSIIDINHILTSTKSD